MSVALCTCGAGNCRYCHPGYREKLSFSSSGLQQSLLNQRPESYSTKGPAVVREIRTVEEEKSAHQAMPKLSVEQVHAELHAWRERWRGTEAIHVDAALALIDQLPRPDVVSLCADEYAAAFQKDPSIMGHAGMRAALRKARELWGLPADPELEGK